MDAAYFRHYQYRLAVCMVPFVKREIGLRLRDMLKDISPYLSLSIVLVVSTHYATQPIENLYLNNGSQNHYGSWALCTGFVETTIYHLPGKH